jgi:cytidylate kinase
MNAIAIDGFSSTGKSSVAKVLAQRLGYLYVDTGAMYRAVALHALRNGWVGPDGSLEAAGSTDALRAGVGALDIRWRREASGHQHTLLNGEDVEAQIRTMEISQIVSKVSAVPQVRRALVAQQQKLGTDSPGVVMDGRDIGTVVFPEAKLKIFMTARPDVRAARRFAEMEAKGSTDGLTVQDIATNLAQRDAEDQARLDSPLLQAHDALVLDNSDLTFVQAVEQAYTWARERGFATAQPH